MGFNSHILCENTNAGNAFHNSEFISSYLHRTHDTLSRKEYYEEQKRTKSKLSTITHKKIRLFNSEDVLFDKAKSIEKYLKRNRLVTSLYNLYLKNCRTAYLLIFLWFNHIDKNLIFYFPRVDCLRSVSL